MNFGGIQIYKSDYFNIDRNVNNYEEDWRHEADTRIKPFYHLRNNSKIWLYIEK